MGISGNLPQIFLSHSKKDIEFVETIKKDLERCQIATWLDTQQIRHGHPWLDSIFNTGIPNCDGVIVYFSENSIESEMVKKEIDASIIQQLKDEHIALLPYVSSESLRDKLRADIKALQASVWNEDNYNMVLPEVVAEI